MADYKLILFDLDGTLIDTIDEIADAVNDTLLHYHKDPTTVDVVRNLVGHGMRQLFIDIWSTVCNLSKEAVVADDRFHEMLGVFDRYYLARTGGHSRLFPYVKETILALHDKGVILAILTNKKAAHSQKALDTFGLLPYFDTLIAGDTFATHKPDPTGVFYCMGKYGVRHHETLMVGDSVTDIQVARNAGIAVWAVPYGYAGNLPIASLHPDRVINNFSSLLELC